MDQFDYKNFRKEKAKKNKKEAAKRVVILGAGQVGTHIMERLSKEGYHVILIDENEENIRIARELAEAATIVGNGCNPLIYFQIGLNEKDLFLAVTDSDETNLVACRLARAFGCQTKIARVRQPFYRSFENTPIDSHFWKRWGIEVLFNQDELTIQEIEHIIENEGAIDTVFLNGDKLQVVGYRVKPNSLLCGRRLVGLRDVPIFENLLVAAVSTMQPLEQNASEASTKQKNKPKEHTLIPNGDYRVKEGDLLYLCGVKENFSGIGELFDPDLVKGFKHIFILGGSLLANHIAERFSKKYSRKTIYLLLKNKNEARVASESLSSKIHVLMADAHDINDLKDEGLDKHCIFIAASASEDDNVLACLLVKEETRARTISIIQSSTYMHLVPYLDVDVAISPKLLLVDDVLKALRGGAYDILSAKDKDAEILDFVVTKKSNIAGKTLKECSLPKNSIVMAVSREEEIIIPRGDTKINIGDHLVFFALKTAIKEIREIFQEH
ncbi:MAG: Trk system potassium transporter TrkA [Spirochaetia bacterium]|nr:Trk system potassium transporter TrkA [Spirochaetia bacterium]